MLQSVRILRIDAHVLRRGVSGRVRHVHRVWAFTRAFARAFTRAARTGTVGKRRSTRWSLRARTEPVVSPRRVLQPIRVLWQDERPLWPRVPGVVGSLWLIVGLDNVGGIIPIYLCSIIHAHPHMVHVHPHTVRVRQRLQHVILLTEGVV